MEDEEAILEVVQEDLGIVPSIDQGNIIDRPAMENTPSLLSGLRLDVKKDSGYGSQGVLGLETLRVDFSWQVLAGQQLYTF